MQIKMDTDAVRTMSSRFRHTADSIDAGLSSIKTTVESADWQSQAREEFIMRLEMLRRTSTQSATVLRMMAQAGDQKAEQWEAIAHVFNGPFHYLAGLWSSILAFFNGIENSVWNAISNIHLSSLPKFVFPSISGAAIIGGITSIIPKWKWNPPNWWPFNKNGENEYATGSGGGSWGDSIGSKNESNGNLDTSSADSDISQPADNKPYPQPPTSPELKPVTGEGSSYTCATYAKARRPDLGVTDHPKGSAYNYKNKFADTAFQIDSDEANLSDIIGPGYAIVWDKGHPSYDREHGHVAIVEEIYVDHIIISEATPYGNNGVYRIKRTTISIDQLNNDLVWLIP